MEEARNLLFPKLELYVFDQGLNLPCSSDPECFAVQVFFRFSGYRPGRDYNEISISKLGLFRSTLWCTRFPLLRITHKNHTTETRSGFDEIVEYLLGNHHNIIIRDIDEHLTPKQHSTLQAMKTMMKHKLLPCIYYHWFSICENYESKIAQNYEKQSSLLSCTFIPGILRRHRLQYIHYTLGNKPLKRSATDYQCYMILKECLDTLQEILGSKSFMLSEGKPCTLDAQVFSYLMCLLCPEMNEDYVRITLGSYPPLIEYCSRISNHFFRNEKETIELPDKEELIQKVASLKEDSIKTVSEQRIQWSKSAQKALVFGVGAFGFVIAFNSLFN